ncbi:MAG: TonB-dependent receptor [Prolixibacteraceae bacterium]|nr:TonB-dependent receptor [Prolixibacteraceae bacterium]
MKNLGVTGFGMIFPLAKKLLRIMKLTFILVLSGLVTNASSTYSQSTKLSIKMERATIQEVFTEIENQSEFRIAYNSTKLDVNKEVNLNVEKQTVDEILDEILANQELTYKIGDRYIVITDKEKESVIKNNSQTKNISGKVIDSGNEPLVGVTVIIKGTTNGTVTDANGNYEIAEVSENDILVFSFVGMQTQEISIGNQSVINVTLAYSTTGIDEVVAIGYGTMKRSDLTGSLSSVSSDDFKSEPVTSFSQALQGRIPGVNVENNSGAPGGNVKIRIRGMNSLKGSNDPLFIVDGVSMNIDISDLNVNDIASIEVLKDASATAIYGSRGANGVILITTKRGKSETPVIQLNVNTGISTLAKAYDLMDAGTFAEFVNVYRPGYFTSEQVNQFKSNGGVDWQDEIFQTGITQDYQVNMTSGSSKTKYYLSANYLDQEGILLESSEKKYSLRSNISSKLGEKVDMDLNIFATRREGLNNKSNGGKNSPNWTAAIYSPTFPVFTPEGAYNRQDNLASPNAENPYMQLKERHDDYESNSVSLGSKVSVEILPDLTYDLLAKADFNTYLSAGFRNQYLNSTTDAYQTESKRLSWENINILTYDKTLAEDHHLTLTGIFEQSKFIYRGFNATGSGVNPINVGYDNLGIAVSQNISSWHSESSLRSYAARINYSFKNRYLVTATYRADGTSKFQGDNKWGYFPSIAAGWKVSEEGFLEDAEFLNYLKLRASWGETGNQGIDSYATIAKIAGLNPNFGLGQTFPGSIVTGADNPDLKWETTAQTNFGVDISFLKGRLGITADYFDKKTSDLLHGVSIPSYNGGGIVNKNIGEMENKGFEIVLTAVPVSKEKFQWETSFNISSYKNKLLSLGNDSLILTGANSLYGNEGAFAIMVDKPLGSFYGYEWLGVYTSAEAAEAAKYGFQPGDNKYHDVNNDGTIDGSDRDIIGSAIPKFIWGFDNSFTIGNFNINLFLQGAHGNKVLNTVYASAATIISDATSITHVDGLDYWKPDNENASFANPTSSSGKSFVNSTQFLQDGSFIKIKNVAVAYNLSKDVTRFADIKFTLSGQNLLTFTEYKGYDPESSTYSGDTDGAVDIGAYPAARTVTFGIQATF